MEYTDLKLPKQKKSTLTEVGMPDSPVNKEKYPYGLEIRFEDDQVKKITGMEQLSADEDVVLHCKATVTSVRKVEEQGSGTRTTVTVQIKAVNVERINKPKEQMGMSEYKKSRGNG